ncbi:MAG: hypothetical protein U0636_05115 [Phycisphaerales bacterium]
MQIRIRQFHAYDPTHSCGCGSGGCSAGGAGRAGAGGGAGAGAGPGSDTSPGTPHARLNLLLTAGGWREDPWVQAVPRVLEPHGVAVLQARSGMEATQLIRTHAVHIAVVDLSLPLDSSTLGAEPAGTRVIQLLRRLEQPPPMVVVRPPQPTRRDSTRTLMEALMDGAFAVVDRPCHPETMLRVLHRIVERHYANRMTGRPLGGPGTPGGPAA